MTEVRLHTNIRRMRPLKVYVLEPTVTAVPCLAGGVAKEESFAVQLYLSENNKERQPAKAFIRYSACLGDACQLPVASADAVSSVTVDTGKRAGKVFDKYVIEAYKVEQDKETVLAILSVGTVCDGDVGDNGPLLVPYGSWDTQRTYRSTSDVKIFVERKRMYYVLTKLNADCVGIDPATDVKNEFWRLMDYVEYMFVNAMVADFGKIGSAVFSGDYMLSQYGVGKDGRPIQTENGYEAFTPDMSNFIPNILLNFVTGYAHFAHGNFAVLADGSGNICGKFLYWDKQGRLHRRREIIRDYVTQEDLADGIIGPDKGSFYSNRLISYAVRDTFTLSDPSKWTDEVLYIESHPITRSGTFIGVLPAKSGELKMYDKATKQYVDLTKAIANRGDGSTAMIVSRGSYWLLENADDFAVSK